MTNYEALLVLSAAYEVIENMNDDDLETLKNFRKGSFDLPEAENFHSRMRQAAFRLSRLKNREVTDGRN